jgi:hypothetical protein
MLQSMRPLLLLLLLLQPPTTTARCSWHVHGACSHPQQQQGG